MPSYVHFYNTIIKLNLTFYKYYGIVILDSGDNLPNFVSVLQFS